VSENPGIFPLGLGYIARILLEEGHRVKVLDINAHRWKPNKIASEIRKHVFDIVGITCLITEYKQVKWLCSVIKRERPGCTIILGGGLPSVVPEFVLQETEADIAVVGEGEITVTEVVDIVEKSGDLSKIDGIWYKKNGAISKTPPRKAISCLDDIPFPAWELFSKETYIRGSSLGFDPPVRRMNMISSRGCTYRCTYCDHSIFGHQFRSRSVNNMFEEMKLLIERYRIRAVAFVDDLFLLDRKKVYEFCDKLLSEGINIMWSCNGRVNLVDKDLLDKMRSAGCVLIGYGIESGSQTILNEMNKKATVDQAKKAINLTWKSGITPFPYMMFGMPGETEKTINETVEFCKEIGIVEGFGFTAPIPGTPLYDQAKELGKILSLKDLVERWTEWGKMPIANLTSLPTERLIALKEKAEKTTANYILRRHKKLLLRKLLYFYQVHGLAGFTLRLAKWIAKFLKRNFRKSG
jgi:radical SAM superfamily enzyme YgiQ (UPF0313 family)